MVQVVAELQRRGLNTAASDQQLRSELAHVIFQENNVPAPAREIDQDQDEATGPLHTIRETGHHVTLGENIPHRPPAESTRLNGDFRSRGAVPRSSGYHSMVTPGGAVPRQSHQVRMPLANVQQNLHVGETDFHLPRGMARGDPDYFQEIEGPEVHEDNRSQGQEDLAAFGGYFGAGLQNERQFFALGQRAAEPPVRPRPVQPRFGPAPGPARLREPLFDEEEGFPNFDHRDPRLENDAQRQRRISTAFDSLRKLNIKFSGAPNEDPDEFIKSLKEGRQILRVTDEELLQCVPFLLSGVARNWYRTTGANWRDFRQFENAWFGRFTNPDFQYALKDEIRARTQHPKERVTDFLTNLKCLLERLQPPLQERDQIREALRNMLPSLSVPVNMAIGMNPWATWADLERLAANVERSIWNAKQYKPPPSMDESMLPGLAFKDGGRPYRPRPVRVNAMEEVEMIDELLLGLDDYVPEEELAHLQYRGNANTTPGTRSGPERPRTEGRCWRCGEKGHRMGDCRNPRRVFCRDCGKPGVRRMNCPDCPEIREQNFCTRCGLIGPTTEECKCARSEN